MGARQGREGRPASTARQGRQGRQTRKVRQTPPGDTPAKLDRKVYEERLEPLQVELKRWRAGCSTPASGCW